MTKFERFLGRKKKVTVGGEEIEHKPLTVKHLPLLLRMEQDGEKADAMAEIIMETLKRSFPEEPPEVLEDFSMEYSMDLVEAIMEVNGFDREVRDTPLAVQALKERKKSS